ncbi:MAG: LamG-like jellyroll fold domain-containing protein [Phycisphaerae bacterium]
MKKEAVKFVLAIVFCVFFAAGSQAATNYYWNDPNVVGNYSWNNAAGNWGSSTYVPILAYPTTGDTAYIYKAKECIIGTDMVGVAKALAANVYVGGLASTNAFLTIKGEASFAASLRLGYAAVADSKGTVRIDTGAVVTVPTLVVGSTGTSTYTSIGDCNLMGTLNVTSAIVIGTNVAYGNGVMTVNGGTLNYTGTGNTFILSNLASSKGKLTVNNGAVVNIASTIYIGKVGIGELIINSGGKVKTTAIAPLQVGSAVGSTGSLTMNGGVLEVGNILHIGTNSANTNFMQLNNDANVMAGNTLQIAYSSATSVGRLTIAGTAKMRVASHIYMGFATAGTGAATIELQGGTLTGMATLVINSGSALNKINITGGTLILPISQFANVNTYIGNGRIYTGYGSSRCIKVQTTATQVIVTADINLLKAAWNPVPATGGTVTPCADANIVLQWSPGLNAISHDVYGGTNYNDVNDANTSTAGIFQGNQLLGDETFELNPNAIPVGQTVYWRIDEVSSTTTTKGNVWSFTREALIESFDSYANTAALQAVWGTNAILEIGSTTFFPLGTSHAGGRGGLSYQSMAIDYNTVNAPYEAKVTQTFACARDLTGGAAKSLVLYFHADRGNTPEVVFVELGDGTNTARVYYNSGDTQRITDYRAYWQFFGTMLSDFTGIDLTNITSISIGAGDGSAAGSGAGRIYIDDVRVYPSTCFASKSAPMGDIVVTNSVLYAGGDPETTMTDCLVNFFDFAGLAINWQRTGETVTAVAPSDSNLVLWYEFEAGSGTTAVDSSVNGNNGDINFEGDWSIPGHSGNALFHNEGVFVTLPATAFNTITNEMTISTWVRNPLGDTGNTNIGHYFDAGKNINSYVFSMYLNWKPEVDNSLRGVLVFNANAWSPPVPADQIIVEGRAEHFADVWNHWAVVADTSKGIQRMYFNGMLIGENQNAFQSIAGITKSTLGNAAFHPRPFFGSSDDFRLYNRALSHAEIVSLAGKASVVQPLITAGDINGDNVVDFKDLSVIFDSWASAVLWP